MANTSKFFKVGQGCKPRKEIGYGGMETSRCVCEVHFWLYLNVCLGCGDRFHSNRPHAKTCSDKCRKRLSRMKLDTLFQSVMKFAGE